MTYPHDYLVFAEGFAAAQAVRYLFAAYGESPGDGDPDTSENCRAEFSPASDPAGPATHYAAECVVTEAQRRAVEAVEDGGGLPPGLYYWRRDRVGVLAATNHPGTAGRVGGEFGLADACAAMGVVPRITD